MALKNAAIPARGSIHVWMPFKPHATTVVRVVSVLWDDDDYWVEATDLRNTRRTVRKSLSTWISSTVELDGEAADAAEAHAVSLI